MEGTLPLAFISMPGGIEWVVIALVALLLFGKRLPGIAKSLGQSLHEFKSGLSGIADEADKPAKTDTAAKTEEKKPDGEA